MNDCVVELVGVAILYLLISKASKMMEGSDSEAPSSMETQAVNCKFFTGGPICPFFQAADNVSWCLYVAVDTSLSFHGSKRLHIYYGRLE